MDLDLDKIFHLDSHMQEPGRGSLLVAKPVVFDPVFQRSVVLLMDHDTDGSSGVIVNKPSGYTLSQLLPEVKTTMDIPVFMGGPVSLNYLSWIHNIGPDLIEDSTELMPGLYFGGDIDRLLHFAATDNKALQHIKFFIGQSGWGANQLAAEIENHDWAIIDTFSPETMLSYSHEQIWDSAVAQLGNQAKRWSNWPEEIFDN